jgi:hypothetical protein
MKTHQVKYFLYLLAAIALSSCSKDVDSDSTCFDGVIRWAGNPAADGLGWVIYEDDSTTTKPFVPQNLSDNYMKDGVKVSVCLKETEEKLHCFCVEPLPKYRITSIRYR